MKHPDYWACLAAIAALAVFTQAHAQDQPRASAEQLVNYAFATQLGSGQYSISGRRLQIYRLPFYYTISEPEEGGPGVRLTLPLTVGFVDFKSQDVLDIGLPENRDTLSFVSGIEFDFELTPHWHLLPFARAGRAWDLASDSDATVYSFGAHAAAAKNYQSFDLRFDVGATYGAVEPDQGMHSDSFVLVEAGIEARRPLDLKLGGHVLDWGAYLMANYFADRPDAPHANA
jgi:hypothetical protein